MVICGPLPLTLCEEKQIKGRNCYHGIWHADVRLNSILQVIFKYTYISLQWYIYKRHSFEISELKKWVECIVIVATYTFVDIMSRNSKTNDY